MCNCITKDIIVNINVSTEATELTNVAGVSVWTADVGNSLFPPDHLIWSRFSCVR